MKTYDMTEERVIKIFMTPKELRNMADAMEEHWKNLEWGDDLYIGNLHRGNRLKINLYIDQDGMEERKEVI